MIAQVIDLNSESKFYIITNKVIPQNLDSLCTAITYTLNFISIPKFCIIMKNLLIINVLLTTTLIEYIHGQ